MGQSCLLDQLTGDKFIGREIYLLVREQEIVHVFFQDELLCAEDINDEKIWLVLLIFILEKPAPFQGHSSIGKGLATQA